MDLKLCTEANIYKALAAQQGMEYVDLDKQSIPPGAVNSVPDDLIQKHLILPLGTENGKLRIALHDPLDMELQDVLRFRLGKDLRPVIAPRNRIKAVIDELFSKTAANTIDQTMTARSTACARASTSRWTAAWIARSTAPSTRASTSRASART